MSQNGAPAILFRNRIATPGLRVRLAGAPGNPHGVGAGLRIVYADDVGPLREIKAGSGYWSTDDPVQVLGLSREPRAVRVRWPDGRITEAPLEAGATEIVIEWPGG